MALYTSEYLKDRSRKKTLSESLTLSQQRNFTHTSFDIFLCHSYLDKEEVEGIFLELTQIGYSVYVDWIIDPYLDRHNITKETAEHVRRRLRSSKSLLLAISANASLSKWVPWELGYIDGHTQACALLPVSKDNLNRASFSRSEYLLLYPFVEKPNDLSRFGNKLFAVEGATNYVEFDSWIRGYKPSYKPTQFF